MDTFDQNNDTQEKDQEQQTATIDTARAYCQHCFDKSITTFQISSDESIKLCMNVTCSTGGTFTSRISYDTNNNENQPKKLKYSDKIQALNATELATFFENDTDTLKCYEDLTTVLKNIIGVNLADIDGVTNSEKVRHFTTILEIYNILFF